MKKQLTKLIISTVVIACSISNAFGQATGATNTLTGASSSAPRSA